MITVEVIDNFSLSRFDEITNLKRKFPISGTYLKKGDIFNCKKDLAKYLLGDNPLNKTVVKIIEIKPESKK